MQPVLGIDLGTSYSCVTTGVGDKVRILMDAAGRSTLPSIVNYKLGVPPMVGYPAQERLITDPENTVYSFKRLLGRRFDSAEARLASASVPYRVLEGPNGECLISVCGVSIPVHQVATDVLVHLKAVAEAELQQRADEAVICVPASFDEIQRESTEVACRNAGIYVRRIINEPTAAALAFGYGKHGSGRVAVYDFGGGTFDFTVLEIQQSFFRVLATAGDQYLGGDDFDQALAKAVANLFWHQTKVEISSTQVAEWQRLVFACERAKRELSEKESTQIQLPGVAYRASGRVDLDITVTRQILEEAGAELLQRSLDVCRDALASAGLQPKDLSSVVMVGGTTLMPIVRKRVAEFFGRTPDTRMNPMTAVAEGAAIQAMAADVSALTNPNMPLLVDVCPHTVGVEVAGFKFEPVITKNTPLPIEEVRTIHTHRDGQTEIRVRVYQGEAPDVRNNRFVGELRIKDLPLGPAGTVGVEVTFEVDVGGRLNVTARQVGSGKMDAVRFRLASQLGVGGG
ncbi:MAG: Hsp70 family protein [Myxococcota bacterium]